MAVRDTIQIGSPLLKSKNRQVQDVNNPQVQQIIQDLYDTMTEAGLVGMSAPQIGENYQIYITQPRGTATRDTENTDVFRAYINPEIVEAAHEKIIIYEGCGSVLHGKLFGPVQRPRWVKVRATDANGKKFEFKADGILGRVIQHEQDHLNGIEFTEKVYDYKQLMTRNHYVEQIKGEAWHQENTKITIKEYQKL